MSVDRVLLSFPLPNQGDLVVAANAMPSGEDWQFLIDFAVASKRAFERKKIKEPASDPLPLASESGAAELQPSSLQELEEHANRTSE